MKIKQRDFAKGDGCAIKTQGEFDDKKTNLLRSRKLMEEKKK